MSKLGVAIIGTGGVAPAHINAFLDLPDCEVRALCYNSNIERAQKYVSDMNLKADLYSNYKEILAREDIDVVSICLPPKLHCESTVAALEAGKHVLLEKPMASSLEECDKILAAQKASGKLLSIVSNYRYRTPMVKVKQMLSEKAGGKLLFTKVNSLWWRGANYHDIWWRGKWDSEGGGCTTSHAVHHLDLMQWMIGMPDKVTAVVGNVGHYNSECEDFAIAIFHYPDMVAQMTNALVWHGEQQEIIFQSEKGRLSVPWEPHAYSPMPNGFPEENKETLETLNNRYNELPDLEKENHNGQISNFVNAILGHEELLITGSDGRNNIELIMAIYKSSVTGQTVELPITKDDPFYRLEDWTASMPRFFQKTKSVDKIDNAPPISFGLGKK